MLRIGRLPLVISVLVSVVLPATEAETEYEDLKRDLSRRERFEQYAAQTFHPSASIHESDRDPLTRPTSGTRASRTRG